MIKAVTFDLDGVYFTPQSFPNFKANLPKKVKDEEKVNWVLYQSPQMLDFKKGKFSESDYWDFAKKELGMEISNEEIFKILRDSYSVNSSVRDYVLKIRSNGLKTCICSNNFVTRKRELDIKFNYLKDFDVVVFSYEVGIMKPDRGIFEALIKQSGVKPDEIIYADDDQSKLAGAIELGIRSFVYEGFEKFQEKVNSLCRTCFASPSQ
jgi:epoxide hydrolase-like predicted phosphatase